nr:TIGR04388 family protein [Leptospira kirschneri]
MIMEDINKTLIYNCESDRSGNPAMQHDFKHCYFGIYEEFEMLRCRLKRRAWFLEARAERNSPKASALGEAMQTAVAAMKMSNLNFGLSYNQDAGLGMNVNTNFTSGLGLGLDYNFKSGDYTENASYDKNHIGGQSWANASFNISASKTGHASASISYNSDGDGERPRKHCAESFTTTTKH